MVGREFSAVRPSSVDDFSFSGQKINKNTAHHGAKQSVVDETQIRIQKNLVTSLININHIETIDDFTVKMKLLYCVIKSKIKPLFILFSIVYFISTPVVVVVGQ